MRKRHSTQPKYINNSTFNHKKKIFGYFAVRFIMKYQVVFLFCSDQQIAWHYKTTKVRFLVK